MNFPPPPPKKKLGQHFLIDPDLLDRFVRPLAGMGVPPGATVVEIGPGRGDLSAALRRAGYRVEAIELDGELIPHLEQRFAGDAAFSVRRADAMQADYGAFSAPLWIAGNLPYQVATPLLVRILRQTPQLAGAVFLLQKEMATRLLAVPSTKDYAAVTALMQTFWEIKKVFHVGRGRFIPPPRVDSTLITVRPRKAAAIGIGRENFDAYEALLRRTFHERRKTLANNLKGYQRGPEALVRTCIDPRRRAESLSLEEFARLFAGLQDAAAPQNQER